MTKNSLKELLNNFSTLSQVVHVPNTPNDMIKGQVGVDSILWIVSNYTICGLHPSVGPPPPQSIASAEQKNYYNAGTKQGTAKALSFYDNDHYK